MPASRPIRAALLLVVLALGAASLDARSRLLAPQGESEEEREREAPGGRPYPADWFLMQRAFPSGRIPVESYRQAVEQARIERAARAFGAQSAGLVWQPVGPYNVGGRVPALAVAPGGTTVYLGSANGGIFKSTDSGQHWG